MEYRAKQTKLNAGNSEFYVVFFWMFLCLLNMQSYWSRHKFLVELGYGSESNNLFFVYLYIVLFVLFFIALILKIRQLKKIKGEQREIVVNEDNVILPNGFEIKLDDISDILISGLFVEKIHLYMKNTKKKKYIFNCYDDTLETIANEINERVDIESLFLQK